MVMWREDTGVDARVVYGRRRSIDDMCFAHLITSSETEKPSYSPQSSSPAPSPTA